MRLFGIILTAMLVCACARAESIDTTLARREFVRGATFVEQSRWGEAMLAFQRSSTLRPHPITLYNTAACARALGQYVRAKKLFAQAIDATADGVRLPNELASLARAFARDVELRSARIEILDAPDEASVRVDGALASGRTIALDPGEHVLSISSPGYVSYEARIVAEAGRSCRLRTPLAREWPTGGTWIYLALCAFSIFVSRRRPRFTSARMRPLVPTASLGTRLSGLLAQ